MTAPAFIQDSVLWALFALLTFAALMPLLMRLRSPARGRAATVALMMAIPALALGGYLVSGRPDLPGAPVGLLSERPLETLSEAALITRVETKLRQTPGDAEGWRVLIPLYRATGRYNDEARALERLATLEGETASNLFALGDALTRAGGGVISSRAGILFERALTLDPSHTPSRAYLALMLAQDGRIEDARAQWRRIASEAPPGAPWLNALERRLESYNQSIKNNN